jgi:hypothetical protein
MDARSYASAPPDSNQKSGDMLPKINVPAIPTMQFLFTHMGRSLEADQTPEDAGMEDGDEILAVEMMDLTGPEVVGVSSVFQTLLSNPKRMRFPSKSGRESRRTGHWTRLSKLARSSITYC